MENSDESCADVDGRRLGRSPEPQGSTALNRFSIQTRPGLTVRFCLLACSRRALGQKHPQWLLISSEKRDASIENSLELLKRVDERDGQLHVLDLVHARVVL